MCWCKVVLVLEIIVRYTIQCLALVPIKDIFRSLKRTELIHRIIPELPEAIGRSHRVVLLVGPW